MIKTWLKKNIMPYVYAMRGTITKGSGTQIDRKAILKTVDGGDIHLGRDCHIHDYAMLMTYGGFIKMGDRCSVNPFCVLYGHGGLTIGKGVRIAAHTVIIPSNHNFDNPDQFIYEQGETSKGIVIGDDVWIGSGVKILDGVRIGSGVVIGAGSVVVNNIPDNAIAVGVPVKVIRYRGKKNA